MSNPDEEKSFEEIGLDARLIRALTKKDISIPTPIQRVAIPLILEGRDVVAQAKTGSGKTFAYILPMLQKLFSISSTAPVAFVLVPTRELSQQVYAEILSIIEICRVQLKVVQITSGMSMSDMQATLTGSPDILVSTPACISTCISKNVLSAKSIADSLSILVLDEADLLLSYGYLNDLETLSLHVPRRCQCLLMSATLSADVEKLKKLVLHNPVSLTLTEVGDNKDEIIPNSVQQFWISCSARDKLLHLYALLKLDLVQKKVLIFVNAIDTGFKLKLFLEQFGIRSAVLNAELPQNSRLHILEEFNAGLFDYLIATDDGQTTKEDNAKKENDEAPKKSKRHLKRKLDSEFGVVRGIDFKNVYTVINFDMPENTAGYVHRIGRTGRAYNTGASVSFVSSDEMEVFEDIKTTLGDDSSSSSFIAPFPLLTQNAVESLRYRAEDVGKSITKVAIRESRAQDLRNEILNSEKLKAHFEVNPKDLDLLKHDRVLSKKLPPDHLRAVPEYLLDATTKEATKIIKLARAAMRNNNNKSSRRQGSGKRLKKSRDPLKTFSADAPKRMRKGGVKRDREEKIDGNRKSKKKATVAN